MLYINNPRSVRFPKHDVLHVSIKDLVAFDLCLFAKDEITTMTLSPCQNNLFLYSVKGASDIHNGCSSPSMMMLLSERHLLSENINSTVKAIRK